MTEHYMPALSEQEARRWSTLAQGDPAVIETWIKDDATILLDLTAALRAPLEPFVRVQLEKIRAKYEREARYLEAVLDGKVSKNAEIARAGS